MKPDKSAGKSRLSGKSRPPANDRSAKRHKSYGIRQFLQPTRPGADDRDSSEEPDEQLPSQTPAVALLAAAAGSHTNLPTVPGAKLDTGLLRSLQHRFAKQQALRTPAYPAAAGATGGGYQQPQQQQQPWAGAAAAAAAAGAAPATDEQQEDWEDEEEDGFQIFSQLAYEPSYLSQRPPDANAADAAGGGISQLATQTQLLPSSQQEVPLPLLPARADSAEDALDWPGSQLLSQPQQSQPQQQLGEDGGLRRASGVSAAGAKTTPALQSAERVQCDGAGPSGQKMFPLFRRRDTMKRLYIVRHGESTYNAAMHAKGSSWADPHIFDAALTDRGKQQARTLRQQLEALDLPPDTLWLASPLQRAMQTLLLACPHAHLLGDGCSAGGGSGSSGSNAENSSAAPNGGGQPPNVMVLHSISEKVVTSGDIGHPASELRKRFPQLDGQLAALPETWWHCPPAQPNCAVQKQFGCHESKDLVMSRIGAFRRWLQDRPEAVIVAVGHSSYWRAFEEVCRGIKPTHMRNCEVRLIHF